MHSDLPSTTLRGYRQTNTADPNVSNFHYLGPLIIAKRDTPVRIKFTINFQLAQVATSSSLWIQLSWGQGPSRWLVESWAISPRTVPRYISMAVLSLG